MKNKNFIAYDGTQYTIEWYFDDQEKSKALEYYKALTIDRKKKLARLLILMGDTGQIHNTEKFRHEDDKIYVFKPSPRQIFLFLLSRFKNHYNECI